MDMEWFIGSNAVIDVKVIWSLQTLHIASDFIPRWRISSFISFKVGS